VDNWNDKYIADKVMDHNIDNVFYIYTRV